MFTIALAPDRHGTGAYLLPDWPAFSFACSASTFHRPIIRVCPPQEVLRTAYGDSACGK